MKQTLKLRIILESPPPGVDFGLQKGSGSGYETIQIQRSGSDDLIFDCAIEVKGSPDQRPEPDFKGPLVQGPPQGRFLYLDIGAAAGQTDSPWSRRLKIPLGSITWEDVQKIQANSTLVLEARVPGTAKDGGPNCATVKPFEGWHPREIG